MTTAQGTEVHNTQGLNLPQRVLVRSASTPMTGSKTASHSRGHSRMAAAVLALNPNTSV
jgi:hypothetical protein